MRFVLARFRDVNRDNRTNSLQLTTCTVCNDINIHTPVDVWMPLSIAGSQIMSTGSFSASALKTAFEVASKYDFFSNAFGQHGQG